MSVIASINAAIKQKGKPQQLQELLLTNLNMVQVTPEIASILEKCKKVEVIELSSCQLESLDRLPVFTKLRCIDLSDNK
jgi:Leucine-rich repeat (LRR) protein